MILNHFEKIEKQRLITQVVNNIRWGAQRNILKVLSQTLTKRKTLKIYFGARIPYTHIKSSTICLPSEIYPNTFIDWILKKGVTLHESYHILFTGNATEQIEKFEKELKSQGHDLNRDLFHEISNIIEDARIEYLGINEFKGSAELIEFTNTLFYKIALLEAEKISTDLLHAFSFEIKNFKTPYPNKILLNKMLKIAQPVIYTDFNGMIKITIKLYKLLMAKFPNSLDNLTHDLNQKEKYKSGKFGENQDLDSPSRKSKAKLNKKEVKKIQEEKNKKRKIFEKTLEIKKIKLKPLIKNQKNSNEEEISQDDISKIKIEKEIIDKETISQIKVLFKEENDSQERIENQTKEKSRDQTEAIEKEFEISRKHGLRLEIPYESYRIPFKRREAESIANMISTELRKKIIIGEESIPKQTSGKLKLKSAVRSLTKYEATGDFNNHIYERKEIRTPKHSVLLMIDSSGSMATVGYGVKKSRLRFAQETIYILANVFQTLDVNFSIRGFEGTSDILIKRWNEQLDIKKLSGLRSGGNTPTAKATRIAAEKILETKDSLKIIFTITDGGADVMISTIEAVKDTRNKGIHVFGIFYGEKHSGIQNYLEQVYGKGNFIITNNGDKLRDEIIKIYEKVLRKNIIGYNNGGA